MIINPDSLSAESLTKLVRNMRTELFDYNEKTYSLSTALDNIKSELYQLGRNMSDLQIELSVLELGLDALGVIHADFRNRPDRMEN